MRSDFSSALIWIVLLQPATLVAAPRAQGPDTAPEAVEEELTEAPVVIDGQVVLQVYTPIAGLTREERAAAIRERILRLAHSSRAPVDSIHVEDREAWSEVRSGKDAIMGVTDQDARAAGTVRQHLAEANAELIRRAVSRYREEHTWKNLLLGLLYAAVATVIFLVLLRTLWTIRGIALTRAEHWLSERLTRAGAGSRWQLSLTYLWRPLLTFAKAFVWLIVIALLQAYITAVLRFFPQTKQTSLQTTSWLSSQLAVFGRAALNYLPDLVLVVTIIGITYVVLGFNKQVFKDIETGRLKISKFYPDWARPTSNLVRLLVLALAAIVVFPYLPGSKSPAFQGITIFLGVLLSLGSSSAVANAVAGTILNYTRAFQVGDMVKIGDTMGQVLEKGLLVTRLRTQKKEVVTIPNGLVMSASVRNYSTEAKNVGVAFYTTVTIGYDAPWRQVHQLLVCAALSTEHVLSDPAPFVLQTALNDFYVAYELNAHTHRPDIMQEIYSALHQNIQDKFNEGGIEINSPHYTALRDGNTVTIPATYRPGSYQPSAFRVHPIEKENGAE
jgi:small-conductance mechanosensitive channel